jgi:hypothetical protein
MKERIGSFRVKEASVHKDSVELKKKKVIQALKALEGIKRMLLEVVKT